MNRSPMRSISRSPSKSPTYRRGRGNDKYPRDPRIESSSNTRDEWTKTTDAFLKNLGAQSTKSNEQVNIMDKQNLTKLKVLNLSLRLLCRQNYYYKSPK